MQKSEISDCFRKNISSLSLSLSSEQADKLAAYLLELSRWNQKINLTAITKQREMIDRLFFDAMTPFCCLKAQDGERWLDIGTGAGFPGLVLKILCPEISISLMEPTLKRVSFLTHLVDYLDLGRVPIITKRIEQVSPEMLGGPVNVLLSRAVSSKLLMRYGPALLASDGHILLQKSTAEMKGFQVLLDQYPDLEEVRTTTVTLPLSKVVHKIILLKKAEQTNTC